MDFLLKTTYFCKVAERRYGETGVCKVQSSANIDCRVQTGVNTLQTQGANIAKQNFALQTEYAKGKFATAITIDESVYPIANTLQTSFMQVANWLIAPTKNSLFLLGGCGTGKTTMLQTLHHLLSIEEFRCWQNPCVNTYCSFYTALQVAKLANDDEDFSYLCKRPILFIDDLGCEPVDVRNYGNSITPFVELLYYRYDNWLPMVISSNLTAKELAERYGERVAERMREMFLLVPMTGESFRK